MSFIQKFKNLNLLLFFIISINTSWIIYCFSLKTDFHVDEFFSLGHSNSSQGAFLVKNTNTISNSLINICFDGKIGHNYISIQPNEQFEYENVIDNLKNSVHPPLYYFIIHTIYSFFPDSENPWLGFIPNLFFLIITLWILYNFAKLVFNNKWLAYTTIIFFGFCLATLNMAVYIRSYMLQMLLATLLFYKHYQLLNENNKARKILFQIFIFSYLGLLTHYYFLVLTLIISSFTCIIYLKEKKLASLLKYIGTILLAVIVFIISFPVAIDVFLHSSRGMELQTSKMAYYLFYLPEFLQRFVRFIMMYILAFNDANIQLFISSLLIIAGCIWMQNNLKKDYRNINYLTYCILFFMIFITIFSPIDFFNDRYFSPIAPILCLVIVYWLSTFFKSLCFRSKIVNIIISILVLLNSYFVNATKKSDYLFKMSKTSQNALNLLDYQNVAMLTCEDCMPQIVSLIADYSSYNLMCTFDINDEDKIFNELKKHKYKYIVAYITENMIYNPVFYNNKDILEETKYYNQLKYIQTFKKGLFVYNLYEIKY